MILTTAAFCNDISIHKIVNMINIVRTLLSKRKSSLNSNIPKDIPPKVPNAVRLPASDAYLTSSVLKPLSAKNEIGPKII